MIQFLVTAVFVVLAAFVLALVLCLMIWVITKLLRFLFPHRFEAAPKSKKPKKFKPEQHITGEQVEDRCGDCAAYGTCPMPYLVPAPCRLYKTEIPE